MRSPSVLLERTSELVAKIGQFEKLKRSAGEAKSLQTRAEQLAPVAERLVRSVEVLEKVRKTGVAVSFAPKDGDVLGKRAVDLLTAFRADPNSLVEPPIDIKYQFVDRLLNVAVAAESASLVAWQIHVAENSEHAPEEILTALAAIPDYRSTVAQIRSLQNRLSRLSATIPPDPVTAIEEVKQIAAEHRETWEKMTAGGIPEKVITFLRACGLDGAPLPSFTKDIETWLKERGLAHLFRIKLQ
jgi:hypothetical protein